MNRGSGRVHADVLRSQLASMRPRFMNRGSVVERFDEALGCLLASMRPRFMNRGSMLCLLLLDGRDSGFNEAPIHESGKFAAR